MRFFLLLPALLAALLSGCGKGTSISVPQGSQQKILLVGNGVDPRTLDPNIINGTGEHHLLLSMFEGLVSDHPSDDTKAEHAVAERHETNADKSVWTFHLRADAKWSDGVVVTAHDFEWSWKRILHKKLGSEYSQMLFILKGGKEWYEQGPYSAEPSTPDNPRNNVPLGVKALDDRTLEVSLIGPTPHFHLVLLHASWWPVPRHVIERHGHFLDRINPWTRPENIVGNGAFRMKESLYRQYIEVEKNPHYWDAANVKLNGIRFYPIDQETTEERLFQRQILHMTEILPLPKLEYYRDNHADVFRTGPNLATYFYRINTTRGAFADPRVRRAMALAVDREELVKYVTRGGQDPALGFVPVMGNYNGPKPLKFDPEEARRLLAEAGYANGQGFPDKSKPGSRFRILLNQSESHKAVAAALKDMWKKHLNIDLDLAVEDWQVYLASQQSMNFDICRAGWNADYVDPMTFLDMWMTGNGNNQTGWSNKTYDELIMAAQKCGDEMERLEIMKKAEAILLDELPVLPLYYYTRSRLVHPAVIGYHHKILDVHAWKHFDLKWPVPASTMDKYWDR